MSYIYEQMGELDKAAELVSKMQSFHSLTGKQQRGGGGGDRLEAIYAYASDTVKSILDRAERYYSDGKLVEFVEAVLPLLEASADPGMRTRILETSKFSSQNTLKGEEEEEETCDERKMDVEEEDTNNTSLTTIHREQEAVGNNQFLLTFKRSKDKKSGEKKEIHFGVAEMGSVISTVSLVRIQQNKGAIDAREKDIGRIGICIFIRTLLEKYV